MQQAARLLAICVFGLGVAQTGTAEACIRSDPSADLRMVSRAISLRSTAKADKSELRRLRATMQANRGFAPHEREAYREAMSKAFKIIDERNIKVAADTKPAPKSGLVPPAAGCG
jgi:hypothetical protein